MADASSSEHDNRRTFMSAAARAAALELRSNPQYMSAAELAQHDGTQPDGMLLIALRSSSTPDAADVLDVSQSPDFYGPGSPYHVLAGRDGSRAFSMTSLNPEHVRQDTMEGASQSEWEVLDQWHSKLSAKYPTVGILPVPSPPRGASASGVEQAAVGLKAPRACTGDRQQQQPASLASPRDAPIAQATGNEPDEEWRCVS